jgi:hypothetical protein
MFFISYGIMFTLMPMIFGAFFTLADDFVVDGNVNADWQAIYENEEDIVQWLVPLVPTIGIMIAVIKILMVASVRGRD